MFDKIDNLNVRRDSKYNNAVIRKGAWTVFLVLSLLLLGATIGFYLKN